MKSEDNRIDLANKLEDLNAEKSFIKTSEHLKIHSKNFKDFRELKSIRKPKG